MVKIEERDCDLSSRAHAVQTSLGGDNKLIVAILDDGTVVELWRGAKWSDKDHIEKMNYQNPDPDPITAESNREYMERVGIQPPKPERV